MAEVLEGVRYLRSTPQSVRVDNGPEFTGRVLGLWAYLHGVTLDFSEPGKPTDNAFIESFNGRFREECLNQHYFTGLEEARAAAEAWRAEYNEERPHSALGNLAPGEFARSKAGVENCLKSTLGDLSNPVTESWAIEAPILAVVLGGAGGRSTGEIFHAASNAEPRSALSDGRTARKQCAA